MTDADARLKALFAADAPPARDASFRLAALERIERRRAQIRLALVAAVGGAMTVAAALVGPQLTLDLRGWPVVLASVTVALAASGWGVLQMRRPI